MEKKKIVKGDVVTLRSGGPWMTVDEVFDDDDARCVWFDMVSFPGMIGPSRGYGERRDAVFHTDTLDVVDLTAPPKVA